MKSFKSITTNGGTTIILDNLDEALSIAKSKKPPAGYHTLHGSLEQCYEAIEKGDPSIKEESDNLIESLVDVIDNINPTFAKAKQGFERTEEGLFTTTDLVATGEENSFLKRKDSELEIVPGAGDGAYRIFINTDVSWNGKTTDNAAVVGAIVTILQRFAPVEIWIQQGWIGSDPEDGVTLFKLDFLNGIDVTQLAFWIGHRGKDYPFSWHINKCLGRRHALTSIKAELPCDLMLRGDWMRHAGIKNSYDFCNKLYTEKCDIMAKYIEMTAREILTGKNQEL